MQDTYIEQINLGLLQVCKNQDINSFKNILERCLRSLGISTINYQLASIAPNTANPHSCWNILIENQNLGVLYKAKPQKSGATYIAEINLDLLAQIISELTQISTVELTEKLIALDVNVECSNDQEIYNILRQVKQKAGQNLWTLEVVDQFPLENGLRYTLRVTYTGLTDQEAKQIHENILN